MKPYPWTLKSSTLAKRCVMVDREGSLQLRTKHSKNYTYLEGPLPKIVSIKEYELTIQVRSIQPPTPEHEWAQTSPYSSHKLKASSLSLLGCFYAQVGIKQGETSKGWREACLISSQASHSLSQNAFDYQGRQVLMCSSPQVDFNGLDWTLVIREDEIYCRRPLSLCAVPIYWSVIDIPVSFIQVEFNLLIVENWLWALILWLMLLWDDVMRGYDPQNSWSWI